MTSSSSIIISPPELREKHPFDGPNRRDPRGWTQRVCLVTGIETKHCYDHQYNREDDPNGVAVIDASIAEVIVALNERGYTTLFCCSGLPEDHIDPERVDTHNPYLIFADGLQPSDDLLPEGVTRAWNLTHWTFSYYPEEARRQWTWLAEKLGVKLI